MSYTSKNSKSRGQARLVDLVFTEEVRKLRPDWLIKNRPGTRPKLRTMKPKKIRKIRPSWASLKAKAELLEIAKNGEDKPRPDHRLYKKFMSYVCKNSKNSGTLDLVFTEEVQKLRPDWLIKDRKRS